MTDSKVWKDVEEDATNNVHNVPLEKGDLSIVSHIGSAGT